MRICYPVSEIYEYGSYGGFGALTRAIAKGVSEKGHEVYVVAPRLSEKQKPVEMMDGFNVLTHCKGVKNYLRSKYIYDMVDADVYHSQEPNIGTWLAMKIKPERKHIITFQDPRTLKEKRTEWNHLSYGERLRMEAIIRGILYYSRKASRHANKLFAQAWSYSDKCQWLYHLENRPGWLPNPVKMGNNIKKEDTPTVCFLGRWDARKRVEWFFELAKKFSQVEFIAMGKASPEFDHVDQKLRSKYSSIPNLTLTSFVSEQQKKEILGKSWVMINTSWRECLPVAYLEAMAHKCAVLSYENPDGIPKEFGYHVETGVFDEYVRGLRFLLKDGNWKTLGTKGFEYVLKHHEHDKVISDHIKTYEEVMRG